MNATDTARAAADRMGDAVSYLHEASRHPHNALGSTADVRAMIARFVTDVPRLASVMHAVANYTADATPTEGQDRQYELHSELHSELHAAAGLLLDAAPHLRAALEHTDRLDDEAD